MPTMPWRPSRPLGRGGASRQIMADCTPDGFDIDPADMTEVVVPNNLRAAKKPEDQILAAPERSGYSADTIFAIKLALEEAMTNAVKHGNRNDPTKHITVLYIVNESYTVVVVRDEGAGFCPAAVPDPTHTENLERPFGRGIMLMNSYMTKVHFCEDGNEVWMLKNKNETSP